MEIILDALSETGMGLIILGVILIVALFIEFIDKNI